MNKPLITVSGKNGQLGKELQGLVHFHPQFKFDFCSKDELDISDKETLHQYFYSKKPSFFINCAAYTAVDKAESDKENAYTINAEAAGNVAALCKEVETKLIHISSDYVFDGTSKNPYKEEDATHPVNYYGYTKWMGEQLALQNNFDTVIIRTSWVYSSYGNNFVKTMLRLINERKEISVVNDQFGSPTYAKDLAEAALAIVSSQSSVVGRQTSGLITNYQLPTTNFPSGIYNFSNEGIITWFDFACAIREIKKINCIINPIPTSAFPTPAKRPLYSVLNKDKIVDTFNINLKSWRDSLRECLTKL